MNKKGKIGVGISMLVTIGGVIVGYLGLNKTKYSETSVLTAKEDEEQKKKIKEFEDELDDIIKGKIKKDEDLEEFYRGVDELRKKRKEEFLKRKEIEKA